MATTCMQACCGVMHVLVALVTRRLGSAHAALGGQRRSSEQARMLFKEDELGVQQPFEAVRLNRASTPPPHTWDAPRTPIRTGVFGGVVCLGGTLKGLPRKLLILKN